VEILPSSIGISTEGQHGLHATVEAAVITVFGDGLFCCALGLRTREGLSPFFLTRSGERRNSDMLESVNFIIYFLNVQPEQQYFECKS
jgi:hypothetical protein